MTLPRQDPPDAAELARRYSPANVRNGINHYRDEAQRKARTKLLKLLVRQAGMDDEDYRTWLAAVTATATAPGKSSSKDCTLQQLSECIDRLKGKRRDPSSVESPQAPAGLEAQFAKIAALLLAGNKPWAYAEGIARRMHKKERLQFCTADQLRGVIAALTRDAERGSRRNFNQIRER